MKKYLWIFLILGLVVGITVFAVINKKDENYISEKTGTSINNKNSDIFNYITNNTEEKIAEFSTKLTKDTEERDLNIELACDTLNGTVVKSGEIFSFWDNLGATTKERGYKKAKTFTSDGEIIQSYGGGVCQISTTIYNAVLKVEGLKVTERHEHSKNVAYIEDGKDAAVSYGNSDFKFKNNLDYDIRIDAKVEERTVKITLVRI